MDTIVLKDSVTGSMTDEDFYDSVWRIVVLESKGTIILKLQLCLLLVLYQGTQVVLCLQNWRCGIRDRVEVSYLIHPRDLHCLIDQFYPLMLRGFQKKNGLNYPMKIKTALHLCVLNL